MEHVLKLAKGVAFVISKSFHEKFRIIHFFVAGVFFNFSVDPGLQIAVIVTILCCMPFMGLGFAVAFAKVAKRLYEIVYETVVAWFWQLFWKLVYYAKDLAVSMGPIFWIKQAFNWVSSFFGGGSDDSPPPEPERSIGQMIKEMFCACVLGLIIGKGVHLAIQLTLYILSTRLMLKVINLVFALIQVLLEESYLSITIYIIWVSLLALVAVCVFVHKSKMFQAISAIPEEKPL